MWWGDCVHLLPVSENVDVASLDWYIHIFLEECLGELVKVLSILLADKVHHKSSDSDVQNIHGLFRVKFNVPKDLNDGGRRVLLSSSRLYRDPVEPLFDKLLEVVTG